MIDNPTVGQRCRLNDRGMEKIGGLKSMADVRASQDLRVTKVSEGMSYHRGKKIVLVEVEPFSIGKFMITNLDLDAL